MSKDKCPAGGEHELTLVKKERLPTGKTKLIQSCKKCKKFFETIVSEDKR